MKRAWALFATTLALSTLALSGEAHPIPAAPALYVLDEAGSLSQPERDALSSILIEHDHLANQQLMVAIFNSLDGEDLVKRTDEVFSSWHIGGRGNADGMLLTVYTQEGKAAISSGIGLDPLLTDATKKTVIHDDLLPELRAGKMFRALGLSTLEVLRALQSPLIESGRAESILRQGGFQGALKPTDQSPGSGGWYIFVMIGILLLSFVLYNLLAAEAHFTGEGWFHPNPWRQLIKKMGASRRDERVLAGGGASAEW